MYLTVEEAKEKSCPMISKPTPLTTGKQYMGGPKIKIMCKCEADKCMAWRWLHDIYFKDGPRVLPLQSYKENKVDFKKTPYGYCGLMPIPTDKRYED